MFKYCTQSSLSLLIPVDGRKKHSILIRQSELQILKDKSSVKKIFVEVCQDVKNSKRTEERERVTQKGQWRVGVRH